MVQVVNKELINTVHRDSIVISLILKCASWSIYSEKIKTKHSSFYTGLDIMDYGKDTEYK